MIGKINHYQSPVTHYSLDKMDFLKKQFFQNNITGTVINVKNSDVDFRIISKEFSLFREVKENPMLAAIANTDSHNNQRSRFCSIGMAVTAIYNMLDNGNTKEKADYICNKNPRNQSSNIDSDDIAMNKRGQEYIHQFLGAETPLASTIYATGLRVGCEMKNNRLDRFMIDQFNATWKIYLDKTA